MMKDTVTANCDAAYSSAQVGPLLKLFGGVGRATTPEEIFEQYPSLTTLVEQCWNISPELTLKCLFYKRDCRKGQGERRIFETGMDYLTTHRPDVVIKNLAHIPHYGSYKDLAKLFRNDALRPHIARTFSNQLRQDDASSAMSLAAKWCPSLGSSTDRNYNVARLIAEELGFTEKWQRQYRQFLSRLRGRLNVVERNMSANLWDEIDFSKVPSLAMQRYRSAFKEHQPSRWGEYMSRLRTGEAKVNADMLMPHEIVSRDLSDPLTIAQWNAAVATARAHGKLGRVIAVPDVSGSMSGLPMNVSTALACLISEACTIDAFRDRVISFSIAPQFIDLTGLTLQQRITRLTTDGVGFNTDLVRTFQELLERARLAGVPQENMPETMILISDMQFDACSSGYDVSSYDRVKQMYADAGYRVPQVVFWNVMAEASCFPVARDEIGVCLVSGFSTHILETILDGEITNPEAVMLRVLNSPRYERLEI